MTRRCVASGTSALREPVLSRATFRVPCLGGRRVHKEETSPLKGREEREGEIQRVSSYPSILSTHQVRESG